MSEENLKVLIGFLWDLLDDIDTASDMTKGNDKGYRRTVERLQKRRWESGVEIPDPYKKDLNLDSLNIEHMKELSKLMYR